MFDTEKVNLSGVPETLLWPLFNRAHEARRPDALLHDPLAVELAGRIDYPFEKNFGRADEGAPLRALGFDDEIKCYLAEHPDATVVALGDGLETQFWRVDNGRLKWISVDLPETIALRNKLLPAHERLTQFVCSALDYNWMKQVDPSRGVFISAQGLLMYFKPDEVAKLITECAARFPGGAMMFDTAPRWVSNMTLSRRGWKKTKDYRVPAMPWGVNIGELQGMRAWHPNVQEIHQVTLARGHGFVFKFIVPLINRLPLIRDKLPAMVLLRFGGGKT